MVQYSESRWWLWSSLTSPQVQVLYKRHQWIEKNIWYELKIEFYFYNQLQFTNSPFVWPHAPGAHARIVKIVFMDHNFLRGKWRKPLSGPFCAYASFINKTQGL